MKRRLLVLTAFIAALALAAPPSAMAQNRQHGSVAVKRTSFGSILTDGRGYVLYLFTRERGRPTSRCYGACARAWPPLLVRGNRRPRALSGANRRLLGTTRRRDGTRQVTYNGHPLYYYVNERRPLQVLCHNVTEFGGVWKVLRSSGRAVR